MRPPHRSSRTRRHRVSPITPCAACGLGLLRRTEVGLEDDLLGRFLEVTANPDRLEPSPPRNGPMDFVTAGPHGSPPARPPPWMLTSDIRQPNPSVIGRRRQGQPV